MGTYNIFDLPARQRRSNPDEYNARGVTSTFVQEIRPGWVNLKYDVLPEARISSKRAQRLIDSTEPYGHGFAEALEELALTYIRANLSEQSADYHGAYHSSETASRRADRAYRTLRGLFSDLIGSGWTPPQWARYYVPAIPPRRGRVVTSEDLEGLSDEEIVRRYFKGDEPLELLDEYDEDGWPHVPPPSLDDL